MQHSIQKVRPINLVGVIQDNPDDPDEENLQIVHHLHTLIDDPENMMVPGDVFSASLPADRQEYYIVFKNVEFIGEQQAYYQIRRYYTSPPKRLDYSSRGFSLEYDPNDISSLDELEFNIIEDIRLDYSIEPGHVLEVNIGGKDEQNPIIIYYKVIKGVLNIEDDEFDRSKLVREGVGAELEAEDTSQIRGGSNEGNFNRASREYLTKIGYLTKSRPQLFLNGKQLQGIAGQQRSNRKLEGFNEAADREYDAAVLDYKKSQVDFYMPALPKSKPGVSKRGGRKKKTQRKRTRKTQRKRKRNKKTKKRKTK